MGIGDPRSNPGPDWYGLVWFYGLSTIVGYQMPNPVYTYMINTYDL